jgi:hypothetical protein
VAHHFKNLLRANRELVHGAYTNNEDQSTITWRDTLRLANLDLDEVEGSLNALSYGLCEHADMLVSMSYDL